MKDFMAGDLSPQQETRILGELKRLAEQNAGTGFSGKRVYRLSSPDGPVETWIEPDPVTDEQEAAQTRKAVRNAITNVLIALGDGRLSPEDIPLPT